jgi:hypothetical protein
MIFHYDPDFFTGDGRSYSEPDSLKLIFSHHGKIDSIDFPEIDLGSCHTLILNEKLKIQ